MNDSIYNSDGVAAMVVRRTERPTEESQNEENYESDDSYFYISEDDDEDDDRKESVSLKNLSIIVPRQLSGKKREALALSDALFASAVPETSTASNPKELDVVKPSASSPDLVLGSQCVHCRFERHDPVGCCDQVTEWVERRHQLCTVPPSVLQMCVARFIQLVADGANITPAEAGIWCRQVGWQLDLQDIRVPRVENIHRNVVNRHVAQVVEQIMEDLSDNDEDDDDEDSVADFLAKLADRNDHDLENKNQTHVQFYEEEIHATLRNETDRKLPARVAVGPNVDDAFGASDNSVSFLPQIDAACSVALLTTVTPSADAVASHSANSDTTDDGATLQQDVKASFMQRVDEMEEQAIGEEAEAAPEENLPANDINSSEPSLSTCPICFEDNIQTETMYSMQCGHAFCLDCWRSLIVTMLSETYEVAMVTSCPQVDCVRTINEVVIEAVMPEFIPRFENHQRHSFVVGHSRTVRWCPGPDCDQVAILPRDGMFEDHSKNFRCDKCSTDFCFACRRAPHQGHCEPDDPDLMPNRVAAVAVDVAAQAAALFDERDDKKRKHCPKCKVPVEKTGGCNRMLCKCNKAFCWLCLGDYETYDSHVCGARQQFVATRVKRGWIWTFARRL